MFAYAPLFSKVNAAILMTIAKNHVTLHTDLMQLIFFDVHNHLWLTMTVITNDPLRIDF